MATKRTIRTVSKAAKAKAAKAKAAKASVDMQAKAIEAKAKSEREASADNMVAESAKPEAKPKLARRASFTMIAIIATTINKNLFNRDGWTGKHGIERYQKSYDNVVAVAKPADRTPSQLREATATDKAFSQLGRTNLAWLLVWGFLQINLERDVFILKHRPTDTRPAKLINPVMDEKACRELLDLVAA